MNEEKENGEKDCPHEQLPTCPEDFDICSWWCEECKSCHLDIIAPKIEAFIEKD